MSFFRFSDLPKEIRIIVYEAYFGCTKLSLRKGCVITLSDNVTQRGGSPLLRVNKLIRQECLPIFAKSVSVIIAWSPGLAALPMAYLTHVTRIFNYHDELFVDKQKMPNLQKVHVPVVLSYPTSNDFFGTNQEKLCKDVVARVTSTFVRSYRVCNRLKQAHSKGILPFQVLLRVGGLTYYNPHLDERMFRANVVVDWEKQQVVEGRPPRYWN